MCACTQSGAGRRSRRACPSAAACCRSRPEDPPGPSRAAPSTRFNEPDLRVGRTGGAVSGHAFLIERHRVALGQRLRVAEHALRQVHLDVLHRAVGAGGLGAEFVDDQARVQVERDPLLVGVSARLARRNPNGNGAPNTSPARLPATSPKPGWGRAEGDPLDVLRARGQASPLPPGCARTASRRASSRHRRTGRPCSRFRPTLPFPPPRRRAKTPCTRSAPVRRPRPARPPPRSAPAGLHRGSCTSPFSRQAILPARRSSPSSSARLCLHCCSPRIRSC